jgi:Papain family cysteine protease
VDCADPTWAATDFKRAPGCRGYVPSDAMKYAASIGGIPASDAYKYTFTNESMTQFASECDPRKLAKIVPGTTPGNITQLEDITQRDLQLELQKQPVVVRITIGSDFHYYESGILSEGEPFGFGHAVLVVGYMRYKGQTVYKVKNSYGSDWVRDLS